MDQESYSKIKKICQNILNKKLHARHLEDMVQEVAMNYWARKEKANINWLALDYLRVNGFGPRSKCGAKTLELSVFVGYESSDNEEGDCGYLLESESEEKSKINEEIIFFDDNAKGMIEEFLQPLNFKMETMKWILNHYRPKMKI